MERDLNRGGLQGDVPTDGGDQGSEWFDDSLDTRADAETAIDRGRQMEGSGSAEAFSEAVDDAIPLGPAAGDSGVERHSTEYESETWDD